MAGRQRQVPEQNLRRINHEAIYQFIYRSAQKAEKLWKFLVRRRARRRIMGSRQSKDLIKDKVHISELSEAVNDRSKPGHWEGGLVIYKHSRPVLVLHERKSRITFMTRLMGKTAEETIAAMQAIFRRLAPNMRHCNLPLSAFALQLPARQRTTGPNSPNTNSGVAFCQRPPTFVMLTLSRRLTRASLTVLAQWQKGGIENANGRIRR